MGPAEVRALGYFHEPVYYPCRCCRDRERVKLRVPPRGRQETRRPLQIGVLPFKDAGRRDDLCLTDAGHPVGASVSVAGSHLLDCHGLGFRTLMQPRSRRARPLGVPSSELSCKTMFGRP